MCVCVWPPALTGSDAGHEVSYRAGRKISVNDDLLCVYCQAQRVEQARQELINQVTESAAKTLETIRGLSYTHARAHTQALLSIIALYSS